jgi:hypothetical protein
MYGASQEHDEETFTAGREPTLPDDSFRPKAEVQRCSKAVNESYGSGHLRNTSDPLTWCALEATPDH